MGESLTFASGPAFRWIALLLVAAAAGLVYLAYRRQPLPPPWGWICAGLKFAALSLLLVLLLEPTVVRRQARPGMNDFLVLVDNGEGMAVHEGRELPGLLGPAMESPGSWFGDLSARFRVEAFAFDEGLAKVGHPGEIGLDGARSDLGAALEGLLQRYARRPLAGILVFSDGNATDRDRLERIESTVPVFPVLTGSAPEKPDLALLDLAVTGSGFEDAPVTVVVQARATGLAGQVCRVEILDGAGQEVVAERIPVTSADQLVSARLRFRGALSGVSAYQARLRTEAEDIGEATLRNNDREFVVDMGRGDYRILYVTGRPNWEYKFLHRALQRDEEVQLVGLLRIAKREPRFQWRGRAGETSNPLFRGFQGQDGEGDVTYDKPVLIRLNTVDAEELRDGFPQEAESLFPAYDAIILDDLEAGFFSADQMELMESYVSRRGGGLLMLGGLESLQAGGYDRTTMGRLLPVYLDAVDPGVEGAPASLRLTREGQLEPWVRLRLTEQEEEARQSVMPAFASVNRVAAIKPGATLLASALDPSGTEFPALAVHSYGQGRVGALMLGDIWRWGMEDPGQRADMETWWRQVARWLVADVPDFVEVNTVWDEPGGSSVRRLEVRVRDSSWRPEENATVELEVARPGAMPGDAPVAKLFAEPSLEEAGLFVASFPCPEPGTWRVQATARGEDGTELGRSTAGWAWTPAAEEFASLVPDRTVLEGLARRTGGELLSWDGLDGFSRRAAQMNVPVTETFSEPAWHRPWWFLLAVTLFAAEWGVRRWKGLA